MLGSWRTSTCQFCLSGTRPLSSLFHKTSTKPMPWESQTEESQVFRLTSLLNLPIPHPQVGVGLKMKILQFDCFTVSKRHRKSCFSNSKLLYNVNDLGTGKRQCKASEPSAWGVAAAEKPRTPGQVCLSSVQPPDKRCCFSTSRL